MIRSIQSPHPVEARHVPQDTLHRLISAVAYAGKWMAQPAPPHQPG
jgi:hypothetical protein